MVKSRELLRAGEAPGTLGYARRQIGAFLNENSCIPIVYATIMSIHQNKVAVV